MVQSMYVCMYVCMYHSYVASAEEKKKKKKPPPSHCDERKMRLHRTSVDLSHRARIRRLGAMRVLCRVSM